MKKTLLLRGLWAVFAFTMLAGCAGSPKAGGGEDDQGEEPQDEAAVSSPWNIDDGGIHWYTWVEDDYVRAGDKYLSKEDYDGAVYWYEQGLSKNPGSDSLNAGLRRAGAEKAAFTEKAASPARDEAREGEHTVQAVGRVPGYTIIVDVSVGGAKEIEPPFGRSRVRDIFTGVGNAFILREDTALWGAGFNGSGQLGTGDVPYRGVTNGRPPVIRIADEFGEPVLGVKSIAAGENHTVILMDDGSLWGAGESLYGEFGLGGNGAAKLPGFTRLNVTDVRAVAAGNNNTFLIKNDGTLWAAGHNYYGQLGLGDRTNRTAFTQVASAGRNVRAVSVGARHTVILKTDGTVWAAGYNFNGQLGLGNTNDSFAFTQVRSIGRNAAAVAAGNYHTVVLTTDGAVLTAGENYYGQLGWDDKTDRTQFTITWDSRGQNIRGAAAIAAGGNLTLILVNNDTLLLAGSFEDPAPRDENNLPPEQPSFDAVRSSFVPLEADNAEPLHDISKIILGNQSIYVITEGDAVFAAGSNRFGQLTLDYGSEALSALKQIFP